MDEALRLVDQIAGTAPLGLAGIVVKIGALRWFLEVTDAILDAKGLRHAKRVWIYFNNDFNGYAIKNATMLSETLSES